MELQIIDKDTRLRVDLIRTYDYVQYTDEFSGEGKFQINLPISDTSLPYLVRHNFIVFEKGIVGIIKSISDLQDESEQITITGKLTNHVLSFRRIPRTERYYGKLSTIARHLLLNHFIEPSDSKRKIDFITLATDERYIPDSQSIYYCDTGNSIRESLTTTFLPYNYGYEMYPLLTDKNESGGVTHNLSGLEFRVLKPTDRTIDNTEGNVPVVFAFQLSNLSRLEYSEDGSAYCSMTYVASEGTGQERTLLEVDVDDMNGYDRVELYVDARDISSADEEGNLLPEEEFVSLMRQRGLEALEEHKVFTSIDGNVLVDSNSRYVYGVDFYKGDYVSIIDDRYQRVFNLQVTSVTKSISNGIEYFDIGFGFDKAFVKKLVTKSL